MPDVLLFVEDSAQEKFLRAMIHRLAHDAGISLAVRIRTATGGVPRVLTQLSDFVENVEKDLVSAPDGLVIAVDANCKGFTERRKLAEERAGSLRDRVVYAIPDPHIERWFLLDSEAFRTAIGRGCSAPDAKCEKQRYKKLLSQSVLEGGSPTTPWGYRIRRGPCGSLPPATCFGQRPLVQQVPW